jgi:hypothetical protein
METLTTFEKWYGRDEPPPTFSKLNAGPYELEFENGDLRYIKSGDQELIRRIYVAIRDVNWNTIPAKMTDPVIEYGDGTFDIQFEASHQEGDLIFTWQASIEGRADGTIEYIMDGAAQSDFRYCRIGFCVLHPVVGIAGSPYKAQTPEGEVSGILPELIEPQWIVDGFETAIFPACTSLSIETPSGINITTDFEGDLFETEDQRNWTDGSFKTYCTPIALGYPHDAVKGKPFYQKVTVKIAEPKSEKIITANSQKESDWLKLRGASLWNMPAIGFGIQDQPNEIDPVQKELLTNLKPCHLKAEVHLQNEDWPGELEKVSNVATQLDSPLELALFLSDDPQVALEKLRERIANLPLARLLVFHEDEAPNGTTSPEWMDLVRNSLGSVTAGIKLYGGTNGNFAELNRQQPDISVMDGIVYTINPQVHAFDERSLVENIEGQHDTVLTARNYSGNLPIAVSAVTLKPPFNQAATEAEAPQDPNELPAAVDQRQMSLCGAAWTVGSLRSLISAGVDSVTYYQTSGWLGLMETSRDNPLPEKFRSYPGMVYPVYYVFTNLAGAENAQVIEIELANHLRVEALAYSTGKLLKLTAANLLPEPNKLLLSVLPGGEAEVTRLNDNSFDLAASNPVGFIKSSRYLPIENGSIVMDLLPYETVFFNIKL